MQAPRSSRLSADVGLDGQAVVRHLGVGLVGCRGCVFGSERVSAAQGSAPDVLEIVVLGRQLTALLVVVSFLPCATGVDPHVLVAGRAAGESSDPAETQASLVGSV